MSCTIKIGRGLKPNEGYEGSFGGLNAELSDDMKSNTLSQIARQLAKQIKMKDGNLELIELVFNYQKVQK